MTEETYADIVNEITPGMWVWFSSDETGDGFRQAAIVKPWFPQPHTFERDLAAEWVHIIYTDGHVEDRPRYGTHEIWQSGPCPLVGE